MLLIYMLFILLAMYLYFFIYLKMLHCNLRAELFGRVGRGYEYS